MVGPREQYTKELYNEWGYLATWVPNYPLRLGDVGFIRKHEFIRTTSLEDLGLGFDVRHGAGSDYNYSSSGQVKFSFKAAGQLPSEGSGLSVAEAGVIIDFGGGGAVVFGARDAKVRSVSDQKSLGDSILQRFYERNWDRELVVVTELIEFGATTILVSAEGGARVELAGKAAVGPEPFRLASLDAGMRVASVRSIQTQIFAPEKLTPLFRAFAIRKPLLGSASFRPRASALDEFSVVQYDDTL